MIDEKEMFPIPTYLKSISESLEKIAAVQTQMMAIAMESRQTRIDMQKKMSEMMKQPPLEKP